MVKRRGKLYSGDVDIVITHKDLKVSSKLLVQLLQILKSQGEPRFLISSISDSYLC